MENPFKLTLRNVVTFLDAQHFRYALIGGIANQVWGQARFTYEQQPSMNQYRNRLIICLLLLSVLQLLR